MPAFDYGSPNGILLPSHVAELQQLFDRITAEPWFTREPERRDEFAAYLVHLFRQGGPTNEGLIETATNAARLRFASDAGLPLSDGSLNGQHVLVVEDEALLARDALRRLSLAGATVIGPASTVQDALELVDEVRLDMALLDIGLDNETVFPVATMLQTRNVPFAFISGRDRPDVPDGFQSVAVFPKPADWTKIASYLIA